MLNAVGAEKEVIKENEVHAKTDPQLKTNEIATVIVHLLSTCVLGPMPSP